MREVSISQPDKHRLYLPLLPYTLGFGLLKLQDLREDPISFLASLILCNLLTSGSSYVWQHRPSPRKDTLPAGKEPVSPSPGPERGAGHPALQDCILPLELGLGSGLCCTRVVEPVVVGEPLLGTCTPSSVSGPFLGGIPHKLLHLLLVETVTRSYSHEWGRQRWKSVLQPSAAQEEQSLHPQNQQIVGMKLEVKKKNKKKEEKNIIASLMIGQ